MLLAEKWLWAKEIGEEEVATDGEEVKDLENKWVRE